ncbi:MAG: hypothetical protein HKN82_14120 [Akkermansiaceae bacterium]|nr:hypothetical protein [Akkermansiaceae bacterium]
MKQMICLGVAAVAFGLGACERHEWEETKQLYEAHGDGHAKDGDGHKKDGHAGGEKKDH